jgi:hypothetical protein
LVERTKTIVHLSGPQCCGKSYLLQDVPPEQKWDVSEFYRRLGYDPEVCPNPYASKRCQKWVIKDLSRFVNQKYEIFFIESSGANKKINDFLRKCEKAKWEVVQLEILPPDEEELLRRIDSRGLNEKWALGYNKHWCPNGDGYSQEEAQKIIGTYVKRGL